MKKTETTKQSSTYVAILLILESLGVAVGVYLTRLHYLSEGGAVCDIEGTAFQCSEVANGPFSEILGVPIAYLGILTYVICMVLTINGLTPDKSRFHKHISGYMFFISLWCLLYSVFLAFVSFLVLDVFCLFCMVWWILNASLFVCSFLWSKNMTEGRWKPVFEDIKLLVRMRAAWAVATVLLIFLIGTSYGLSKIEVKTKVKVLSEDFDLSENPVTGDPSAPVQIIEVSDPKCPWCSRAHNVIKEAGKTYGDKFYVVFVFYPLDRECNERLSYSLHPQACIGSLAARCAQNQGKFWEYLDLLFERQRENWDNKMLSEYARELGMDADLFSQCITDPETDAFIQRDIKDSQKNEVHATPTFYFNGKDYGNVASGVPKFVEFLEKALFEGLDESDVATGEATVIE